VHPDLLRTEDGFIVLQLKEKEIATREAYAKDRPEIVRSLRHEKMVDAVARYVAELRKAAGDKLSIDERFAEEPKGGDDQGG
jgi:hypothetical protein